MEISIKRRKETNDEFVDVTLYKQVIGQLRYLCITRPYIYQIVGLVSRFMKKPKTCHLLASKRILRIIRVILNHFVLMSNQKNTMKKRIIYD